MSQQGRSQYGGDAEVPILVHSSTQAPVVARDGVQGAAEWPDKSPTGAMSSAPQSFEQQGTVAHTPLGQLQHSLAHLVPQMRAPGAMPAATAAAKSMAAAGRLTRAQQSELEMARRRAQKAAQGKAANTASARRAKRRTSDSEQNGSDDELQHKLSTVTDEKEAKRLKRLLRNRVSAQQARERKKSYVATLEDKARTQEQQLAEAQQRIKTLERENVMLRSVMKNMQGGGGGGHGLHGSDDIDRAPAYHSEAAVPVISSFPRSSAF